MAISEMIPVPGLSRMREAMKEMLEESLETRQAASWEPAVDVLETDSEYVIHAELPGVSKGDIHVDVAENTLIIKGERKPFAEDSGRCLLCEREFGAFHREFVLPSQVEAGKVMASDKNGVLEIRIPKSEQGRTRSIKVE